MTDRLPSVHRGSAHRRFLRTVVAPAAAVAVTVVVILIGCVTRPQSLPTPPVATSTLVRTGSIPPVDTATLPKDPRTLFFVDFSGIICHVNADGDPGIPTRAVLIDGSAIMHHEPMLWLPDTVDFGLLYKYTGQQPRCAAQQCGVPIDGIDLKIRGADEADSDDATVEKLTVDASFRNLSPHLRDNPLIDGGDLDGTLKKKNVSPSGPGAAHFEMDRNGRLSAVPFFDGGIFSTDSLRKCTQFADVVTWSGVTNGSALLKIRSRFTLDRWEVIPIRNTGPLQISVENLAANHMPTTAHFTLNSKVLASGKAMPTITTCVVANPTYPPGANAINAVPGCSDTQWP